MKYTAKFNAKTHTVTIHSASCTCVASGSVWALEAENLAEAVEVAKEDAPNVAIFKIAPCASDP